MLCWADRTLTGAGRPKSPAKGQHIKLAPETRLADAFAIYGVPRNITHYMRQRKIYATPRAHMTGAL